MPVGSGLGSSACSVVAALHGLNAYYDNFFSSKNTVTSRLSLVVAMETLATNSL